MNVNVFSRSISACLGNGNKLLEDAKSLFDWGRHSTALALAILAQEEFAKAFLLQLVADEALPWLPAIQRSMARHQCKHLLAVVMEWLPPFDLDRLNEQRQQAKERHEQRMAWYQRSIERSRAGRFGLDPNDPEPIEEEYAFPLDVATALNIYRFEEIEKLRSGNPWRDLDWASGKARKIADGLIDRKKQTALYVDITRTGEIGLHPGLITRDQASDAIERAQRLSDPFVTYSVEYQKLKEILPHVFSGLDHVKTDE